MHDGNYRKLVLKSWNVSHQKQFTVMLAVVMVLISSKIEWSSYPKQLTAMFAIVMVFLWSKMSYNCVTFHELQCFYHQNGFVMLFFSSYVFPFSKMVPGCLKLMLFFNSYVFPFSKMVPGCLKLVAMCVHVPECVWNVCACKFVCVCVCLFLYICVVVCVHDFQSQWTAKLFYEFGPFCWIGDVHVLHHPCTVMAAVMNALLCYLHCWRKWLFELYAFVINIDVVWDLLHWKKLVFELLF